MNNLETILQIHREPDEDWQSVFQRLDSYGALDFKTLTKVVIYLIERIEENGRTTQREERTTSYTDIRGEDSPIQERVRGTNEEVRPDAENPTDDSDNSEQSNETLVI